MTKQLTKNRTKY